MIEKTNICCLDLTQDCLDYLKSLDLNVYDGSLGSVFAIKWVQNSSSYPKRVLTDVDYPENLHEYHVFIHDMENPHIREYKSEEHVFKDIESAKVRYLECHYPINYYDLRPFGTNRLVNEFSENFKERRIEIIFVGRDKTVEYSSNVIGDYSPKTLGVFSSIESWNLVTNKEKCGQRVKLEDNGVSRVLFEGRLNHVYYYQVFKLPTVKDGEDRVIDKHYTSLLANDSGECVSYLFYYSNDYIKIVLPQVEDKAALLKELFENFLFKFFSNYFPDIEASNWILNNAYLLPDEVEIQNKIETKRKEFEQDLAHLENEAIKTREKNSYLKHLLTDSGSSLVLSVKSFLEWLGFNNVINKDETLEEGELKEEDLCFDYEGSHIIIEVKGINGTSTDSECSQVDKIVNRRMREIKSTDVHGVYVVNHQRNIEPLKRQIPPFNDTQIKDAVSQSRTLIYTMQLFALYSDIENGYIKKDKARKDLLQVGLAQFHNHLSSLGVPYNYYLEDKVICLDLQNTRVNIGDTLYYKDSLDRLIGLNVECIQQEKKELQFVSNGKTGIKVDRRVPRNREILMTKFEE